MLRPLTLIPDQREFLRMALVTEMISAWTRCDHWTSYPADEMSSAGEACKDRWVVSLSLRIEVAGEDEGAVPAAAADSVS